MCSYYNPECPYNESYEGYEYECKIGGCESGGNCRECENLIKVGDYTGYRCSRRKCKYIEYE